MSDVIAAFDPEEEPEYENENDGNDDSFAEFSRRAGLDDTSPNESVDPRLDGVDPSFFDDGNRSGAIEIYADDEGERSVGSGAYPRRSSNPGHRLPSPSDSSVPPV